MRTSLNEDGVAQYILPLFDVLEAKGEYYMNPLIGEVIEINFLDAIHCIETGKKIKKTYGDGMSYEAWLTSPMSVESIIHPELSRIHEGIALRDKEWEEAHHNQPHYVYLSKTSGVKVGVTRVTNVPYRWIDQGATEAIIIAETPYRQLAGLIEVSLKNHMADKTAWQAMLKNAGAENIDLLKKKNEALDLLPGDYESFFYDEDNITRISYPVLQYPVKIKSLKIEKDGSFKGRLMGIKGQYLIFEDGTVFNVRAHSGYQVGLNVG
jgi:hypothetical protein